MAISKIIVKENKGATFQIMYLNLTIWFLSQVDLAVISVFYFIFSNFQNIGHRKMNSENIEDL
jgi:hypothetical protein